ncbi:ABC-three component system middle component 7 [Rhodanobacter koreensis]
MITPNKVVALGESALGLSRVVLEQAPGADSILDLQHLTSKHFESIDQFLLTIDLLFVLGKISVDFTTGKISHAG